MRIRKRLKGGPVITFMHKGGGPQFVTKVALNRMDGLRIMAAGLAILLVGRGKVEMRQPAENVIEALLPALAAAEIIGRRSQDSAPQTTDKPH